jgi:hypothetical protein
LTRRIWWGGGGADLIKPLPTAEDHYRKAWVGSTSIYDAAGTELHTWRYAVQADADPTALASRVANDVAWILKSHPNRSMF